MATPETAVPATAQRDARPQGLIGSPEAGKLNPLRLDLGAMLSNGSGYHSDCILICYIGALASVDWLTKLPLSS